MAKSTKTSGARASATHPETIPIRLDGSDFVEPFFANRFSVSRQDGYIHISLGCFSLGMILKTAVVIIPEATVILNKDDVVKYYNKFAETEIDDPSMISLNDPKVFYAQLMTFAKNAEQAEMNPCFFRIQKMIDTTPELTATAVVSVNMPFSTQMGLIKSVYISE